MVSIRLFLLLSLICILFYPFIPLYLRTKRKQGNPEKKMKVPIKADRVLFQKTFTETSLVTIVVVSKM